MWESDIVSLSSHCDWFVVNLVCRFDCNIQVQQSTGVLRKRCSENIQQIYRRSPMPKCEQLEHKVEQLYWDRTSAWVIPVNLLYIFRTPFPKNTSGRLLLNIILFQKYSHGQTYLIHIFSLWLRRVTKLQNCNDPLFACVQYFAQCGFIRAWVFCLFCVLNSMSLSNTF